MALVETCFGVLDDPRAGNTAHRLGDLLVMMVAASLCGAASATEFALFAQTRKAVLSRLISYERAPSHDTFSRLLRFLDPNAFAVVFARFARGFAKALAESGHAAGPDVVAVDGKALRRAYETGRMASPPLTVSAFAAGTRLCLAAGAPMAGENEVEAALKIVELIDLTGKIITADALHCHHRMAGAVMARGGGYVLALKGNRHHWLKKATAAFAQSRNHPAAETTALAHGRREWRKAEVLACEPLMQGHAAFVRVTTSRDEAAPHVRLFVSSAILSPQEALAITRAHWQIENGLHWMLDVHLCEDLSRARKDNAPANTALINRMARNILQMADHPKVPISHRIKKCAWNDDYLIHAITHMR